MLHFVGKQNILPPTKTGFTVTLLDVLLCINSRFWSRSLFLYRLIQDWHGLFELGWMTLSKTLSDRLQKPQNRAARVLTSSSCDTDAKGLIRQLGWKDLYTQRQIQKALMVYKSLNGLVPEYLSSKFLKRSGMRYSLRDSENKLLVPLPRTN